VAHWLLAIFFSHDKAPSSTKNLLVQGFFSAGQFLCQHRDIRANLSTVAVLTVHCQYKNFGPNLLVQAIFGNLLSVTKLVSPAITDSLMMWIALHQERREGVRNEINLCFASL